MTAEKTFKRKLTPLGLPNRSTVPVSNKCSKKLNICKPRCRNCFWFKKEFSYHICTYPDLKNKRKKDVYPYSPACSYWNVLFYSLVGRLRRGKFVYYGNRKI